MPQATEICPWPALQPERRVRVGLQCSFPALFLFLLFFFLLFVFLQFTFLTEGKLGTRPDPKKTIKIDLKINFFPHRFLDGFFMFLGSIFGHLFDDFSMFFASLLRDHFLMIFLFFFESIFEPHEP